LADAGRYSRQRLFRGLGDAGQARVRTSSAVLVGCGALGSSQADLLVRAGIGRLRIIDRDSVETSNLQRQTLFSEADADRALPKAVAAAARLRAVNSEVEVEGIVADLVAENAASLLDGFDLLLDGCDSFETRFLLNDVALETGRPWIYGAVVGAYGLVFPILPGETACLRCLVRELPAPGTSPTCDTAGVIGPAASAVAALQAAEALKLLGGRRDRVRRDLLALELWEGTVQALRVRRDPACPACADGARDFLHGTSAASANRICGRGAVQIVPAAPTPVDLDALAVRLAGVGSITTNPYLLRLSLAAHQITVFRDGRAIVGGTEDPAEARSLLARYVGA
jgi:adenylyltransferase/sulfurtransferase